MKKDKGLGDTIERITNTTGISKIVKSITKECGCKKRKDKLNNLFPYKNKIMGTDLEKLHPIQNQDLQFKIKSQN
jgi:hypothetical protein